MSEGELKKQIQDVISGKKSKNGTWYDKDVMAVLDEAKQEYEQLNLWEGLNPTQKLLKLQIWFEKWFGEVA